MNSYITKSFQEMYLSSIGIDFRTIKTLNKTRFLFLDSYRWGGFFDSQVKAYIKNADAVILLFDLSEKEDFDNLPKLLNMITEIHELKDFPVLLIGNKSDLEIKVNKNEIEKFLDKENFIGYFEVSSKTNKNVDESVDFMVNYIYKKEKKKFL